MSSIIEKMISDVRHIMVAHKCGTSTAGNGLSNCTKAITTHFLLKMDSEANQARQCIFFKERLRPG